MYNDVEIKQAVRRELDRDQRCAAWEIGIAVQRGVVTLTGTVVGHPSRRAVGDAAYRAPGVAEVVNRIKVLLSAPASRLGSGDAASRPGG